jgi:peptidyl-tRNA hydrolase, PTH1 family
LSETKLIVGLGNPGPDYEWTRHNLGFLVLKGLVKELGLKVEASSITKGFTAEGEFQGHQVCLLMPLTFVNKSGGAVRSIVEKKGVAFKNLLVVCDDLNLKFSQIRLRSKGSDGGHNGLTSLIQCLQSEEFARLRIGIGQPKNKQEVVDYVLEEFTQKEKKDLDNIVQDATQCCLVWLRDGINKAMEEFNKR